MKRSTKWLLFLIILLGAALRLYHLGTEPIWYDEAVSLTRAQMAVMDSIDATIRTDFFPPLYYIVLHFILLFGNSEFILRLFSALCGILIIPLTYDIGKTISGKRLAMISTLLVAISPLYVMYSQEARTYSFYLLSATLAMWGLAKLLRYPMMATQKMFLLRLPASLQQQGTASPDRPVAPLWAWGAYILGSIVTLYCHNTGVFLPVAANLIALYLFWIERPHFLPLLRNWLIANALVLLVWGLWLPGLLQQTFHQSSGKSWFSSDLGSLLEVVNDLWISFVWGPRHILVFLLLILVVLGLWSWRKHPRWIMFSLTLFLVPVLGHYVVSQWIPMLVTRSMIWASIPLLLMIAAGLINLRWRFLTWSILTLIIAINVKGLNTYYLNFQKEKWDKVAEYIGERLQPNDGILINVGYLKKPFDYYWKHVEKEAVGQPFPSGHAEMEQEDLAELKRIMTTHDRLWIIYSHTPFGDPKGLLKKSLDDNARLIDQQRFRGTGFQLNCQANCIQVFLYETRSH